MYFLDMRLHSPRFSEENFAHNLQIVHAFQTLAAKAGCTPAQMCLAWVISEGDHIVPLPGSGNPGRIRENIAAGNITIPAEILKEVSAVVKSIGGTRGTRYPAFASSHLFG